MEVSDAQSVVHLFLSELLIGHLVHERGTNKSDRGSWRDGSEAESTSCSYRGPEFQGTTLWLTTSIMRPSALFWCADIHADRTQYT